MAGTSNTSFNPPPANNGWGVVGFILSIIGLLTCGTLNFLSLPVSLIGLIWRPRGFAIAGTIISLLGAGFFTLVGAGIVMMVLGIKGAATSASQRHDTDVAMQEAKQEINRYRVENNRLPDGIEGNRLVVTRKDAWGTELRYEVEGKTFVIRSAGKDQEFDTEDDLTSNETMVGDLELDFGEGMSTDGPIEVPTEIPEDTKTPPTIDEPSIDAPTADPEKTTSDNSDSE